MDNANTDSKVSSITTTTANVGGPASASYGNKISSGPFDAHNNTYIPYMDTGWNPNAPNRISSVDDDGKVEIGHNNIHIQPLNSGFLLTMNTKEEGFKHLAFEDYKKLLEFLEDNILLDKDAEIVADNV